MDIASSTGAALPNALTTAQGAPAYTPPAASKKAADTINERKEAERSDHHDGSKGRDAKSKESRNPTGSHLGRNLDIAL